MKVTADGEIEWESPQWENVRCASSDTSIRIRCDGRKLEGSANIGRFQEPDNRLGLTVAQCVQKWRDVLARLGYDVEGFGQRQALHGPTGVVLSESGTHLRRIDLAGNLETDDYNALTVALMSRRIGQKLPALGKYGPMWGYDAKRGEWWKAKLYDKTAELEGLRRSQGGATLARFEVQLGGQWLRRRMLDEVSAWRDEDMGKVIYGEFAGQVFRETVTAERWDEIPIRLRSWAVLWRDGIDIRGQMSTATYYRTRTKLLEHGIDIGVPCNVQALMRRVQVVNVRPAETLRMAA